MKVKDLIKVLQGFDQNLSVRTDQEPENFWVTDAVEYKTLSNGHEIDGEVILVTCE